MDIEKATVEIGGSLKEDTSESIKTTLENVKREFATMQISLKAANSEAQTNRIKASELRGKLEDADLQISKLSDDTKLKEIQADHKSKFEELKKGSETKIKEFETLNTQLLESQKQLHGIFRKEFVTSFEKIKEHPNFEKIKDILKLPEKKEDKYDFNALSDEDVLFNKSKLAEYNSLGLFEVIGGIPSVKVPLTEKITDVDIVELAKSNHKEARKWLDKKRGRNVLFK